MDLSNLQPAEGSKHSDNFRRGRGHGSGNGKTAGKGHKGQKARSGATFTWLDLSQETGDEENQTKPWTFREIVVTLQT